MDWSKLQAEHRVWVNGMYPDQPTDVPAAGMVEEAGELVHALLKRRQRELWGEEQRYRGVAWQAELEDAIGDCAIYAVSYCNATRVDIDQALNCKPTELCPPLLAACAAVKVAAANVLTPDMDNVREYIYILRLVCDNVDIVFEDAVQRTWDRVKRRVR
jgi:NTP pyrophosphatase (non-canonical NTP hydrolase)